ncbi:MAG: helix-turn-helix domain-containing protein [Nitrososphaerota archaeon]|jgi:predicted transcriptional regulator|nr:helix-turn-helix domain-containing protein [Nitrososphaerota archaeon]
MMNVDDIDVLLEVLGNDTRRRILQLLADEPRYFIQLSKDLGVSQQAVLKHLEILERHGFVSSFEGESDYAAPKRKYYHLNRSCMLAIGITKDAVQFVFHDIPQESIKAKPEREEFKLLQRQLLELESEKDPSRILNLSDSLLKEINLKLTETANTEIALLKLKQNITRTAHEAIRNAFDEDLQRQILYSTIGEQKRPDVDELSEMLDAREREINEAMKALRQRLQGNLIFE